MNLLFLVRFHRNLSEFSANWIESNRRIKAFQDASLDPNKLLLNDTSGGEVPITLDNGELPVGLDGYVDLTRRCLSIDVNVEGSHNVVVQAYSQSGAISAQGHVIIFSELCDKPSQGICEISDYKVEIMVSWSYDPHPYSFELGVSH